MPLTVENVCALLIRSRLMTKAEAKAVYRRWLADSADRQDTDKMLRWLVAQELITAEQAGVLARGGVVTGTPRVPPTGKLVGLSGKDSPAPKTPAPTPAQEMTAPESSDHFDVELVPALPYGDTLISFRGVVLTRRDVMMLGIGAGGVMFAGLVGMLIAKLTSRREKLRGDEPDEEKPKD